MKNKICFDNYQLIFFLTFIIALFYIVLKKEFNNPKVFTTVLPNKVITKEPPPILQQTYKREPLEIVNYPRELNDPYVGPERNTVNHINYSNVGFVTAPNGDKFTLFARQKAYRSNQYEYYISDKSNTNIKYPVKYKNHNELFDKDTLDIPQIGGEAIATIYDLPEIRYTPYL